MYTKCTPVRFNTRARYEVQHVSYFSILYTTQTVVRSIKKNSKQQQSDCTKKAKSTTKIDKKIPQRGLVMRMRAHIMEQYSSVNMLMNHAFSIKSYRYGNVAAPTQNINLPIDGTLKTRQLFYYYFCYCFVS